MFESNADLDFDDILNAAGASFKRPSPKEAIRVKANLPLPRNVVKRKFPGPAGLLPETPQHLDSTTLNDNTHRDDIPCSQRSLSVFEGEPWLEVNQTHKNLIDRFNIKWIKTSANLNKLDNQKAPFLAAIIQNIEIFDGKNPIVNVILKDATGDIQGTIMHNLYEEYSNYLKSGTVIVLKQFGVLTTSHNCHLTITPKNLVTIVTKNGDEETRIIQVQEGNFEKFGVEIDNCKHIWDNAFEGLDPNLFFSEDFS